MNELDRFFKDKLHNRQIEFNEAHWQEAEKMLDRQGKRRPVWIWWTALGVLLLVGGAWWGLTRYSASAEESESAIREEADIVSSEHATILSSEETTAASTKSSANQSESVSSESKTAVLPSNQEQSAIVKNKVAAEPAQEIKSLSKDKAIAENRLVPPIENLENDASTTGNEQTGMDRTIVNSQASQKSDNLSEGDLAGEEVVPDQEEEHKELEEIQNAEEPSDIALIIEENSTKPFALLETIGILNPDFLEIPESATNFKDPYKIKSPKQLSLGFHAMGTLYPNVESGTRQLIGSNVGLNLRISGRSPWGFRTGLNYRIRGGQFSFTDSLSEVTYSFGRSEKQFTLTPRSVHYVELPLLVSYRLNRHEVQAGGQIGYLWGVKGQLEVPLDGSPLRRTTEAGWMQKDGFKNIRVDLSLGYHYAITRHLKAGLLVHYTPMKWIEDEDKLIENGPFIIDLGLRFDLF